MAEITKKLNLGCGEFKKVGYINVDVRLQVNPDVAHDLNRFPYPFPDNGFDVIEVDHVLEHLDDAFRVMRELHRISKNNGLIVIKVPHFSRGFTHPDHKRGFDVTFPYYFNPKFEPSNQGFQLQLKNIRFCWFAQPYVKKMVLSKPLFYASALVGAFFDVFANISPILCSRLWCYWVGGFEEVSFEFLVEK